MFRLIPAQRLECTLRIQLHELLFFGFSGREDSPRSSAIFHTVFIKQLFEHKKVKKNENEKQTIIVSSTGDRYIAANNSHKSDCRVSFYMNINWYLPVQYRFLCSKFVHKYSDYWSSRITFLWSL